MGACATKPGDLKGEAPLVVEDGAEKAKADAVPVVTVAAEADTADAGRRRSLSDLLKQDAETTDDAGGEAGQEAAAKAVAAEPASEAGDAAAGGAAMGEEDQSPQEAPVVQASVAAAEQQDGTAQELKAGPSGDGDAAQEAEEEKRVVPESVQVVADAADADAAPSAEESKPAAAAADASA